jgi:hypothetical protein
MKRLYWWREAIYVLAFYGVYSVVRNLFGSAGGGGELHAFNNAKLVRSIERALGSFHEETIQEWFLDERWFIQFWNLFYGTFHFAVTTFCIFWLFRRFPERYVKYRTTLAATTALALIGFATFPLMPPRLIPEWGFVDTLKDYGGLWSFDSGTMQKVSNQYAAMPSLHFAWSTWCAMVLVPTVQRRWLQVLAALYPVLTLFAIVVTANHFWIDAAGGAVILAAGYAIGSWWARRSNVVPETIRSEDRVRTVDDEGVSGVVGGRG